MAPTQHPSQQNQVEQAAEHGLKLLATEACTRALLSCAAHRHAVEPVLEHALAVSMVHAPLATGGSAAADAMRGWNDCLAFLHAYHDKALHQRLCLVGGIKAMLFDVMEYERCLSVGADQYRGAAINIFRFRQGSAGVGDASTVQDQLVTQVSNLTRDALAMQPIPASAIKQHPAVQRLAQTLIQLQTNFRECKTDQYAFAQLSLSVLALLEAEYDLQNEGVVAGVEESEEQSGDGATVEGVSEQSAGQQSDDLIEEPQQPASDVLSIDSNDQEQADNHHAIDDAASVSSAGGEGAALVIQAGMPYRAYTTAQDETIDAGTLTLSQAISTYRAQLDAFIGKHGSIVNRLSARLRQLLLAQQRKSWVFDQEEGMLDTSRLCRVVTSPSNPLTFKSEVDGLFKDTTVSLLIDNSKSMVGKPIATAAACADILSQTLERCGVSVEILGFTTTELHGSDLLAQWQHEGSNEAPGRMNGLRHIIYKHAAVPYRRASVNLGAMLDPQLLKQNIDGEAVMWAYERLRVRPSTRKILIVISDGAPLDASTLTANPKDYLVAHLHQSIAKIESDRQIELCAIGINHDVSHYYKNAISIHDTRDLGKALLAQLVEVFKQ